MWLITRAKYLVGYSQCMKRWTEVKFTIWWHQYYILRVGHTDWNVWATVWVTLTGMCGSQCGSHWLGRHWLNLRSTRVVSLRNVSSGTDIPVEFSATVNCQSQLTVAHSSTHVPPAVHNNIHVQQGTRQPPSAPPNTQLNKNRGLQLVPILHTLRSDLNNRTKFVNYNRYHIDIHCFP